MSKQLEQLIFRWTGKIIQGIGLSAFILTIFFDKLAGRLVIEIGLLQSIGLIFFFMVYLFGTLVEEVLRNVDDFLNN